MNQDVTNQLPAEVKKRSEKRDRNRGEKKRKRQKMELKKIRWTCVTKYITE